MAQIIHVGSGSGKKRANVIFLHGLGGDPYVTWGHGPDDKSFWPLWLAHDIPWLAVFSLGYEASVSRWRGRAMHLPDRAANVLARILAEPELKSGRLILIGHSLGGLVIKQVLQNAESEARHDADAASFLERVDKVAFLATPHTGSDLAAFGNRIRIFVRPSAATACLVRNDPNLRGLNSWYRTWANARGISHLTLTETDATSIFGMVVKPDSGDPGLAGSNPVPIDSDHKTICKPIDRTHDTYVFVRKFVETRFERPKTAAEEKLDAVDTKLDKLLSAIKESGGIASVEKAGVSQDAIIKLAQRIDENIADFDQALLELERAVEVSVEVAEEGRRGSNTGDFVDAVLARIAEKSNAGLYDQAAAEADAAFGQWERDEKERRDAAVAGGLKLLDAGLKQDILRRDALSAAKRIAQTVELEHPDDWAARFSNLRKRQDEWYESGRDKGLNFDLLVSIEVARLLVTAAAGSDEIATVLNDLAVSLSELGDRERGTALLEEAVDTYRAALQQRSRENMPLWWARTQNNLGTVLQRLAERDTGTARLEQAIDAYRAALQELTRERVPLDWAATQTNLGATLATLGDREEGTARFEQAVDAYRSALLELTRERAPLDWAMTQNNLGNALARFCERESGTNRLEEAVKAYSAALLEYTRERLPLDWAKTQNNLGNALSMLGERESGTARLEEAVAAYRAALMERTRERVPHNWAMTQNNLGSVLVTLGERGSGTERLEEAVEAYRAALLERTRERVPHLYDRTQEGLAKASEILERRRRE